MFNYLKYRYQLRILTNKQKKISKLYSKEIGQALKQNKSDEEIEQLRSEDSAEYFWIQEEIDILITNYLRNKANTLFVPLPDRDDEKLWEECHIISQKKVLTTRGINTVNAAIRKERLDKLEILFRILAALVPIIGVIIGLIAVIKR